VQSAKEAKAEHFLKLFSSFFRVIKRI